MAFKLFNRRKILDSLLQYKTQKISIINNYWIGFMFRAFQFIIIGYIFGFTIIYKKGYQEYYGLSSSLVTKVKGIGVSTESKFQRGVWDDADIIVPPQYRHYYFIKHNCTCLNTSKIMSKRLEENAIFITTKAIITANQTQRTCAENPSVKDALCQNDSYCSKDKQLYLGNGIPTGRCVHINKESHRKTCEILAWCPLENSGIGISQTVLLKEVPGFTIFIRNMIIFDELNIQRSNLFVWTKENISKDCIYNPNDSLMKHCPNFKVSSIIGNTTAKKLSELLDNGGIFRVIITWDCDLNWPEDNCKPSYDFSKIDISEGSSSVRWNFRYANYYEKNNREYRTLYKVFGIRILIEVRGKAGKFSLKTCTMKIGSGLAFLAIANFLCDILICTFFPKKEQYSAFKYEKHTCKDGDIPILKV